MGRSSSLTSIGSTNSNSGQRFAARRQPCQVVNITVQKEIERKIGLARTPSGHSIVSEASKGSKASKATNSSKGSKASKISKWSRRSKSSKSSSNQGGGSEGS